MPEEKMKKFFATIIGGERHDDGTYSATISWPDKLPLAHNRVIVVDPNGLESVEHWSGQSANT